MADFGIDEFTTYMLHCDGADTSTTFTDETGKTTAAGGNAQIDTAQSVFGGASGLFDGTGDYVETNDNGEFTLGSQDWTIDFRIRPSDVSVSKYVFGQNDSGAGDMAIYFHNNAGVPSFSVTPDGSTQTTVTSSENFLVNTWYHVACVRSGNTLMIFINGVNKGTAPFSGAIHNSSSKFTLGRLGESTANTFAGWIDEFRISRGIARWTTDFTPPTTAYQKKREFLSSASSDYLNLQSGNAAPYFYVEALISGVTSVFGVSYSVGNYLVDGGVIDREKPIFAGDRSNIFSSDVTIKLDNSTQRFSPQVTGSQFYDNDYLNSPVNYYGGFLNISGTALVLQRGSFILDNLKLDSRNSSAFLRLRDKFKKALTAKIGDEIDASGTALQFIITGIQDGASAIQSLLITGAGLTAGDTSIVTAGQSFNNLSLSEQSVAEAVSLVAEACDAYIFTNRRGVLQFVSNAPVFGTAPAADFTIRESDWALNTLWEQNRDDRVQKVIVDFKSGIDVAIESSAAGVSGTTISISNDVINNTGDAVAIASRIRDRFSGQVTRLEIPSIWAPSIDIGDVIAVHATSLGLIGANYEVYKIEEEMTQGTMRLFLLNEDRVTGKWGFYSHATGAAGAGEHSAVFAGSGASQSGAWQAGFAFFAGQTTGFDADGDANGTISSAVTSSGAGGTGIEVAFQFY